MKWGVLIWALAVSPAGAFVTVYTDRTSFLESLVQGFFADDFQSVVPGVATPAMTRSGGGFTVQHTSPGFSVYGLSGGAIGSFNNGGGMQATMTSVTVYAAGANFFYTDVNELFAPGKLTITLVQTGNTTIRDLMPTNATTGSFLGFVSDLPLTSLSVAAGGAGKFTTYDNFIVGVPEPVGGWLVVGAGTVWWGRRRR